ncbi:DUF418 domain-containing protein [Chryseomicrobium palamuruense]|uniref:DUF418 domain-containing protein n=1 Tax=Chryseomicrobium palamuruense TaxID=682973 RepID=A0ABV8USW8_9BACL
MQPLTERERYKEIDVLRGIALLGILLVNMLVFHSPYIYIDPFSWYQLPKDQQTSQIIDIWFQGSFYPLFAMLFGFGLALQADRMKDQFIRFGIKRMGVLLVLGILHVLLLWAGDILITYAASGFILLFLLRLSKMWLITLGTLFYFIPNAAILLLLYGIEKLDPSSSAIYTSIQGLEESIEAYGSGSFIEIFFQRLADWNYMNQNGFFLLWMLFSILPLMMFGAFAAKASIVNWVRTKRVTAFVIGVLFFAMGTWIKWIPYLSEGTNFTGTLQTTIGGPIQAIGYALLLLVLLVNTVHLFLWRPFERAGRMSLTIYLLMSLLATTFFYSYGLGFYGKVDVLTGTWIGIGLYALCVIFAELWLTYFKQGPMEKLWRYFTYPRTNR